MLAIIFVPVTHSSISCFLRNGSTVELYRGGQLLISSLLKKASEPAIATEARKSSSPKANKKRDSMSQRTSK
jgi:hypothetical protein